MLRQFVAKQAVDQGFGSFGLAWPMAATALESCDAHHAAAVSDECGAEDDDGEWDAQEEDPDEASSGEADQDLVLESALADANHGFDNDRKHRRLEAEEQRDDDRNVAPARINVAQRHNGDDA